MKQQLTNYQAVLDYLYTQLPMFQRVGGAYKKDLSNTIKLCDALGNPENKFKSIHIAGTNGKGSCAHYLSSILQESGYKTGLYTSPHLKDFTERIKINGSQMPQPDVVDFVNTYSKLIEEVKPSFFEITVAMAFEFFAQQEVDIAVVEVGMGGRLDSTNVITPEVSLITNISKDHEQWLGSSLGAIATEKGGIIKEGIPVVIGEKHPETETVFTDLAENKSAPIHFAIDTYSSRRDETFKVYRENELVCEVPADLLATYQVRNIPSVFKVCDLLNEKGFAIDLKSIEAGIRNMSANTGLKGRWQVLQTNPKMVCDVGHNEAGVLLIVEQFKKETFDRLHIVWGTVNDKDVRSVLKLLPQNALYYFCQAQIPRALPVNELADLANEVGLKGQLYNSVGDAVNAALKNAKPEDLVFVGGSTFVVAELDQL